MTSSSVLRQETLHTLYHDGFWKSDHDFQLMIHSNFLATMHGFRDNEAVLPTAYGVIVISLPGGASRDFSWWFWKSGHDFLIAFHSNFLSGVHGFRDNEVLLLTGNDVIVISPLGGVSHRFCWQNLNEQRQFHNHGSWHISYRFRVIWHFILADNCPFWIILGVFLG